MSGKLLKLAEYLYTSIHCSTAHSLHRHLWHQHKGGIEPLCTSTRISELRQLKKSPQTKA